MTQQDLSLLWDYGIGERSHAPASSGGQQNMARLRVSEE